MMHVRLHQPTGSWRKVLGSPSLPLPRRPGCWQQSTNVALLKLHRGRDASESPGIDPAGLGCRGGGSRCFPDEAKAGLLRLSAARDCSKAGAPSAWHFRSRLEQTRRNRKAVIVLWRVSWIFAKIVLPRIARMTRMGRTELPTLQ